jgi:hypothetical protein
MDRIAEAPADLTDGELDALIATVDECQQVAPGSLERSSVD